MRKTLIFIITLCICIIYSRNTFPDQIRYKKDTSTVVYTSSTDLTYNPQRQAQIMLKIIKKYPKAELLRVVWKKNINSMNMNRILAYSRKYDRLYNQVYINNRLDTQEIYIGRIIDRLNPVATGKKESFDFKTDRFAKKGNTSYLIAPGFSPN